MKRDLYIVGSDVRRCSTSKGQIIYREKGNRIFESDVNHVNETKLIAIREKIKTILNNKSLIMSTAKQIANNNSDVRKIRIKTDNDDWQEFFFYIAICSNTGYTEIGSLFLNKHVLHAYPNWSGDPLYPVKGGHETYKKEHQNGSFWLNKNRWEFLEWLDTTGLDMIQKQFDHMKATKQVRKPRAKTVESSEPIELKKAKSTRSKKSVDATNVTGHKPEEKPNETKTEIETTKKPRVKKEVSTTEKPTVKKTSTARKPKTQPKQITEEKEVATA